MDCHERDTMQLWSKSQEQNTWNFVSEKYVNIEENQLTATEARRICANTIPFSLM